MADVALAAALLTGTANGGRMAAGLSAAVSNGDRLRITLPVGPPAFLKADDPLPQQGGNDRYRITVTREGGTAALAWNYTAAYNAAAPEVDLTFFVGDAGTLLVFVLVENLHSEIT
jgi:hypothetical protein